MPKATIEIDHRYKGKSKEPARRQRYEGNSKEPALMRPEAGFGG